MFQFFIQSRLFEARRFTFKYFARCGNKLAILGCFVFRSTPLKTKNHRNSPRSSSPAALGIISSQEEINDVNIDDLSEAFPQVEISNLSTSQKTKQSDGFVKGHQKTLSLPPVASDPPPSANVEYAQDDDVTQNRSQSCSDAPASVKEIVTAIESLHSPEPENGEGIKRSASLPTWRKKAGPGNFSFTPEGITEAEADASPPDTNFFIGDADDDSECQQTQNVSDVNSNNSNNNNLHTAPEVAHGISFESPKDRHRMSPEVLQMIREVLEVLCLEV